MKRIWFTQQKPFDYIPLRLGLGYLTAEQADEARRKKYHKAAPIFMPKLYTTRTHKLNGDYYVVEGSRFKAKPVEPRIEFTAHPVATIQFSDKVSINWYSPNDQIPTNLPELDLGIRGSGNMSVSVVRAGRSNLPELDLNTTGLTFDHLRDELFKLNKNVTADTLFHINKLERIYDG